MITTKQQLIEYCLRKLGDPIVKINVTDDQIDDCFEQSIEQWWHFHPDGLEKMYLKHRVTGSKLTLSDSTGFIKDKYISNVDQTATIQIYDVVDNTIEIQKQPVGKEFQVGDTVLSADGVSATITAIELGDVDNGWVPVSDMVYGITRVQPFASGQSSSRNLFDLQYQLRLNNIYDLSSTTLAYYAEVMQHVQMIDSMLNGKPMLRFNRLQNKLFLDIYWGNDLRVGDYLVAEGYRVLDPDEYHRVFGEPWLRKYLIATIKQQWGTNLKKWQGVQLVGGVTVDGQSLYDEGTQEMKDLEDEIVQNGAPLEFFIG